MQSVLEDSKSNLLTWVKKKKPGPLLDDSKLTQVRISKIGKNFLFGMLTIFIRD